MDYESDINSYTSFERTMRHILRTGDPDRDEEAIREFDRVRGHTRVDIYNVVILSQKRMTSVSKTTKIHKAEKTSLIF